MNDVRKEVRTVKKEHNFRKQCVQVNYELTKSLVGAEVGEGTC
jgi:hypothetical protein